MGLVKRLRSITSQNMYFLYFDLGFELTSLLDCSVFDRKCDLFFPVTHRICTSLLFAHHVILKVFFCPIKSFWVIISNKINVSLHSGLKTQMNTICSVSCSRCSGHLLLSICQMYIQPRYLSCQLSLCLKTVAIVACISFYVC